MKKIIGVLVTLMASHAFSWSAKEHIQFTRMAGERLLADPSTPPAMRDWLRTILPEQLDEQAERWYLLHAKIGTNLANAGPGVQWWAVIPDERALHGPREIKVPPFDQHERLMHFLDMELFLKGDQPRTFRPDLSGKPAVEDIPRDWHDARFVRAGYLPFAVENAYRELVASLRARRLVPTTRPTTHPSDFSSEDCALKWAGFLAHYVQDSTQPQHGTIDYKSASYFKNRRNAPDVHAELEYRLLDDAEQDFPDLRARYWEAFSAALGEHADPIETDDLWLATVQTMMRSYDALPLVGQAAAAAVIPSAGSARDRIDTTKFFAFAGKVGEREMTVLELKARQCAWAVQQTQRVWKQAWLASQTR